MSTSNYVSFKEIADPSNLYNYIQSTLPTLQSVSYNAGIVSTFFSSPLSVSDQSTLGSLIAGFSNTFSTADSNNFRVISSGNSTIVPLLANGVFTGLWEDVSQYIAINILINTNVSGTLVIQFSLDGSTVDYQEINAINTGGDFTTVSPQAKFGRLVYTNGPNNQTTFRVQTTYNYYKTVYPAMTASDTLSDAVITSINRNVLAGKTTSANNTNMGLSSDGGINVDASKSVFGTLLINKIFPISQRDFTYAINGQQVNTSVTGSGSVTTSTLLTVASGAATNSSATLQGKSSLRYRPGQGLRIKVCGTFSSPANGNTQYFGITNDTDSLFFGYNGTNFGINYVNNSVATFITKSNWNVDKMDGTGLSGMNLDPTKGNIYVMSVQWHGFGIIRFFIEEPTTGKYHEIHRIQYANANTSPSFSIPYFNLYASSTNTTNNTNMIVKVADISASVEGMMRLSSPMFSANNTRNINSLTPLPIMTLRIRTTFNSLTNKINVHMKNLTASTDSRFTVASFIKNATLGGTPVYTNFNTADSVVEYDTAATTVTGGVEVFNMSLGTATGNNQDLQPYDIVLEPGETLTCAAYSTGATNVSCGFIWIEDQ